MIFTDLFSFIGFLGKLAKENIWIFILQRNNTYKLEAKLTIFEQKPVGT